MSTAATPGSQAVGVQDVWWDGTGAMLIVKAVSRDGINLLSIDDGRLDYLDEPLSDIGACVSGVLSAVQNVQNNTFIAANIPGILQVPASGNPQTVTITLAISDETGSRA